MLVQIYIDKCDFTYRGMVYLRKLKRLTVLRVSYNKLENKEVVRLILNFTGLRKLCIQLTPERSK